MMSFWMVPVSLSREAPCSSAKAAAPRIEMLRKKHAALLERVRRRNAQRTASVEARFDSEAKAVEAGLRAEFPAKAVALYSSETAPNSTCFSASWKSWLPNSRFPATSAPLRTISRRASMSWPSSL